MGAIAMMLSGGTAGGGSPSSKTITIDHTKVGSTDSSNFPMLFSGTYSYLKTVGNGGSVQNANGYDIGFYSDSGLTTKLKWEVERYVASTGEFIAWVKIPTLSHTSDTVIYLGYGNASITTDQSDRVNTWDSFFKCVYHFKDGTTLSCADATTNANDLVAVGPPTATTGIVDGGCNLGGSGQSATLNSNSTLLATNLVTVEAWFNPSSLSDYSTMAAKGNGGQFDYALDLEITSGKPRWFFTQGNGNYLVLTAASGVSTGAWKYHAGTYDGSTQRLFLNGVANGTRSQTGNVDSTPYQIAVGKQGQSAGGNARGVLDEVRVSIGIARSVDWLLATFNSINSPSTFYTLT